MTQSYILHVCVFVCVCVSVRVYVCVARTYTHIHAHFRSYSACSKMATLMRWNSLCPCLGYVWNMHAFHQFFYDLISSPKLIRTC